MVCSIRVAVRSHAHLHSVLLFPLLCVPSFMDIRYRVNRVRRIIRLASRRPVCGARQTHLSVFGRAWRRRSGFVAGKYLHIAITITLLLLLSHTFHISVSSMHQPWHAMVLYSLSRGVHDSPVRWAIDYPVTFSYRPSLKQWPTPHMSGSKCCKLYILLRENSTAVSTLSY